MNNLRNINKVLPKSNNLIIELTHQEIKFDLMIYMVEDVHRIKICYN